MKIISDTTTLVTGKPGAQETVPPGEPADVSNATADRLIARGQFRKYVPPGKKAAAEPSGGGEPINLNEDGVDALRKIDGVGPKTAKDIVASREADGPFKSPADCAERVGGVSLEQLEAADVTV